MSRASRTPGGVKPSARRLLHDRARPIRFSCVGGIAALFQLGVFALFIRHGVNPFAGNAVAFLFAAQINFLLSSTFTWRLRTWGDPRHVAGRWMAFHAAVAYSAMLNFVTFMIALHFASELVASAAGIAVGAVANYLANDRVVFARETAPAPTG
jgi:putative flippase GtrA